MPTFISQRIIFWITFVFILVMIYSKSWLPGMSYVGNKEELYIIAFCLFIIFLVVDFSKVLFLNINIPDFSSFVIYLLLLSFFISLLFYNSNELTHLKSLAVLLSYALIILVFYFLLPRLICQNREYWLYFIKIIANFGFIFTILGIIILMLNLAPSGKWGFAFLSIIGHPNNTSIVFTITFLPTLYLIYWKWKSMTTIVKSYYLFSLLLQVIGQLFTFTRAGIIATVFGFLIFFILRYRTRIVFILPFFIIAVPLFLLSFIQAKGWGSFISRLYLLVPAYEMIFESKQRMLWGYGVTNSLKEYSQRVAVFEEYIKDPHNTYVTLILMFGVVFTLLLLILIINLLYKTFKQAFDKNNSNDKRLYFIFLFCSTISLMLQGIFDAELIKYDYYSIHYLLIILGTIYLSTKKNANSN